MIEAKFSVTRPDFALAVDIVLPEKGITVLFGASGSGKSTLLRCIAGLEQANGTLRVNGKTWQDGDYCLPPHQRQVGYVFQDAHLFPHLTVMQNVHYGRKRQPNTIDRYSVDSLMALLGIQHLLTRKPAHLSGGEKQRVAIARALAANPNILLMDEPMAALDMKRKREILPFLEKLRDELAIPVVYVTHDMHELVRLADEMVLLEAGQVIAQGDLNTTMAHINNQQGFSQSPSIIIEATITEIDSDWHLAKANFDGGAVWLRDQQFNTQQKVRFIVMDKDVSITRSAEHDSSISNVLPAKIDCVMDGEHPAICIVRLKLGKTYLLSRLTRRSLHKLQLKSGDDVWAQIKLAAIIE